jgi:hypothetical protein
MRPAGFLAKLDLAVDFGDRYGQTEAFFYFGCGDVFAVGLFWCGVDE